MTDTTQLRKLAHITIGCGNANMNGVEQDAGMAINECCDTIERLTAERDALAKDAAHDSFAKRQILRDHFLHDFNPVAIPHKAVHKLGKGALPENPRIEE